MKHKLSKLGTVVTGFTPSTKKGEYYSNNGYPFITPTEIKNTRFCKHSSRFLSEKTFIDFNRRFINANSVLVDCIGSDMGNACLTKEICLTNQQINAITNIKTSIVLPEYLYYRLSVMKNYFHSIGMNGSTMPIISKSLFEEIEIDVPDISFQQHIVNILGSLDDSIENCYEKIKKYLQLVSLKYTSLIANKPFNAIIADIANVESGKRPNSKVADKNKEYFVPIVGASSIMEYTNRTLFNEPILVIGRVGTHGIVQPIFESCWASDNTLIIKTDYYSFVYNILNNIDYASINKGSTQPLITQTDIKNTEIYIPSIDILEKFETDYSLFPLKEIKSKIEQLKQLKQLYLKKFFD